MLPPLVDTPWDVDDDGDPDDSAGGADSRSKCNGSLSVRAASIAPDVTEDNALRLREYLAGHAGKPEVLEQWLLDQLEAETGIMREWCSHWEARIDDVDSSRDHQLIRSIFMQRLDRLKKLSVKCLRPCLRASCCRTWPRGTHSTCWKILRMPGPFSASFPCSINGMRPPTVSSAALSKTRWSLSGISQETYVRRTPNGCAPLPNTRPFPEVDCPLHL
jgi:hypothetical protein